MRSIADELALVQNPIDEEDLLVHILSQLGDEYGPFTAAIKVRENPISFPELFDKLVDFERSLKETESAAAPLIATANFSQRQTSRFNTRSSSDSQFRSNNTGHFSSENQPHSSRSNNNTQYRNNRSSSYCHFCAIPGHETRDCRKLARFLKDYNVTCINTSNNSVANATASSSKSTPATAPWLFDTGASHHLTSDRSSLHTVSEYGGPDEIVLGDGTTLSISHTGHTNLSTSTRPLNLSNVLCVPNLRKNLISVAKLCRANQVSVEFFPLHFLVKDLCTGAPLMRGENINDVYYTNQISLP